MFALKLVTSGLRCNRLNQRCISVASGRLGIFGGKNKAEEEKEENPLEIIDAAEEEIDFEAEERRIRRLRNKSGLLLQHRRMLNDEVPYDNAESWVHETLKYKRKMYAKFGSKSKIDPRKFALALEF